MTGIDLRPRDIVVNDLATDAASTKVGIKAVTDFGYAFLDAIEKKENGIYTKNDQEQLTMLYEKAVNNVDNPKRFTDYFGLICKTYGYI